MDATLISPVLSIASGLIGLFGKSAKDIANDNYVDSLLQASQSMGISGFTHEDIVHLLPGDWGESGAKKQAGSQLFDGYCQIVKGNGLGKGGVQISPGQDASSILNFGGNYYPNHKIFYTPNAIGTYQTQSTITPGSGGGGSLPISNKNNNYLLIGAGAFLILIFVAYKKGLI